MDQNQPLDDQTGGQMPPAGQPDPMAAPATPSTDDAGMGGADTQTTPAGGQDAGMPGEQADAGQPVEEKPADAGDNQPAV